jgi:hypothetical protein
MEEGNISVDTPPMEVATPCLRRAVMSEDFPTPSKPSMVTFLKRFGFGFDAGRKWLAFERSVVGQVHTSRWCAY